MLILKSFDECLYYDEEREGDFKREIKERDMLEELAEL